MIPRVRENSEVVIKFTQIMDIPNGSYWPKRNWEMNDNLIWMDMIIPKIREKHRPGFWHHGTPKNSGLCSGCLDVSEHIGQRSTRRSRACWIGWAFMMMSGWWLSPTPLKNMSESHLGWWNSQFMEKQKMYIWQSAGMIIPNIYIHIYIYMEIHKIPWCQSPPTRCSLRIVQRWFSRILSDNPITMIHDL